MNTSDTRGRSTTNATLPSIQQSTDGPVVIEDFSSWPGENRLGEYSNAGAFANGDGELVEDALRLEFDDGGWFLSNVRADLSGYTHLELDVRGDDGGEESAVFLEIDSVAGPLGSLTDESIETEFTTVGVDLEAVGVDPSSVQDVWLTCWNAGSGAIEIDELRFVDRDGDTITVGDHDARDPDGDGRYDDVTGDGLTNHEDVEAFYEHLDADGVQENPDAFDFDEDGHVSYADVLELLDDL
ncbi:dockerin type I domain-containing protein [Halopiger goleimassiliensis]|uniref:dockerin type I domain-containing protein n=1 Tax=Halopiger goleimassiliensis TaxID=1293048 RepID=UPI000677AD15|nr:dockerin type I domain-containing protein [Halopiger goleimassiliensis]